MGKKNLQPVTLNTQKLQDLYIYTSQLDPRLSPSQLFLRYFVWKLIVCETNTYERDNLSDAPHVRPWEDVKIPEMQAFVGSLIMMGILHLPCLEMYWQFKHPILAMYYLKPSLPLNGITASLIVTD